MVNGLRAAGTGYLLAASNRRGLDHIGSIYKDDYNYKRYCKGIVPRNLGPEYRDLKH